MKFHGPATIDDFDYDRASVVLFFFVARRRRNFFLTLPLGFGGHQRQCRWEIALGRMYQRHGFLACRWVFGGPEAHCSS